MNYNKLQKLLTTLIAIVLLISSNHIYTISATNVIDSSITDTTEDQEVTTHLDKPEMSNDTEKFSEDNDSTEAESDLGGSDYEDYKELMSEDINNYIINDYHSDKNWTYRDYFEETTRLTNYYYFDDTDETIYISDFTGIELFKNVDYLDFDIPICDLDSLKECIDDLEIKNFQLPKKNSNNEKIEYTINLMEEGSYYEYLEKIGDPEDFLFEEVLNLDYELYIINTYLDGFPDKSVDDLGLYTSPYVLKNISEQLNRIYTYESGFHLEYITEDLNYLTDYEESINPHTKEWEYVLPLNLSFDFAIVHPKTLNWIQFRDNNTPDIAASLSYYDAEVNIKELENFLKPYIDAIEDKNLSSSEKDQLKNDLFRLEFFDKGKLLSFSFDELFSEDTDINKGLIDQSYDINFSNDDFTDIKFIFNKSLIDDLGAVAPFNDLYIRFDLGFSQYSEYNVDSHYNFYGQQRYRTPTLSVNFNYNYDLENPIFETYHSVIKNDTINKPNSDPKREGYTFKGWYDSPQNGNLWDFDKNQIVNDLDLYAKWEINTYTVNFVTDNDTPISDQQITHGKMISEPDAPIKNGYSFAGWFLDERFEEKWQFNEDTVTTNMTLYAKWEPTPIDTYYTVSFDTNGGNAIDDIKVLENSKITDIKNPIKPGSTFQGWYQDNQFISEWNLDEDSVVSDMTLYAKWELTPIDTYYTVSFDTNGGNAIDDIKVLENSKITDIKNPIKPGSTFQGWYQDNQFISEWNLDEDSVISDMTLYAKWELTPIDTYYTVSFDTNGGNAIDDIKVLENSKITDVQNPIKNGFTFQGWYQDIQFINEWNLDENSVVSDMTLYAKWEVKDKKSSATNNDNVEDLPTTGINNNLIYVSLGLLAVGTIILAISKKNRN